MHEYVVYIFKIMIILVIQSLKKKNLKPDVFPTQYVNKNIIKILQDKADKINECE